MRIVLARPLSRCPTYDPEIQEPLGIGLLAAVLRKSGHEVLLTDAMLSAQLEEDMARSIAEYHPHVVGLSLMSDADLEYTGVLIKRIQSMSLANIVFVAGGSFVSTDPESAESLLPDGTLLIRYEGEIPLLRLTEAIERCESCNNLQSLVWNKADSLNVSLTYECIENLDSLPWPARDIADIVLARCGFLNIQGSRGCTGCCAYCCAPGMPRPLGQSWRGRSPENIAGEIFELNQKYGVAAFNFVDDDFLGLPQHAEKRAFAFAEAIRKRNLHIGFGAQFRPQTLTPGIIEALAEAGLSWAFIGIENDDASVLQKWHRPPATNSFWDIIVKLKEHRVEIAVGTILFHPDATLDSLKRFSTTLYEQDLLNYRTATSRLHLLPGSHLYEVFRRNGQIPFSAPGPFTPPVMEARVEQLYIYLCRSLSPLRPCWIHAACQLPGLVSQVKAGLPVAIKLQVIRGVLSELDAWVYEVLNTLIAKFEEEDVPEPEWLATTHAISLKLAQYACDRLESGGLISDPMQLREAIETEGDI